MSKVSLRMLVCDKCPRREVKTGYQLVGAAMTTGLVIRCGVVEKEKSERIVTTSVLAEMTEPPRDCPYYLEHIMQGAKEGVRTSNSQRT